MFVSLRAVSPCILKSIPTLAWSTLPVFTSVDIRMSAASGPFDISMPSRLYSFDIPPMPWRIPRPAISARAPAFDIIINARVPSCPLMPTDSIASMSPPALSADIFV